MKWVLLIIAMISLVPANGVMAQSQTNKQYIENIADQDKNKKEKVDLNQCGQIGKPIRIATFETNPPFGWVDVIQEGEKTEYVNDGFSIGLFEKLAQENGISVKRTGFTSFQNAMNALARGNVDMLVGIYFDASVRPKGINFISPSFFRNAVVAVFLKDKFIPVEKYEDLVGLKGVIRKDEHLYELIYNSLPDGVTLVPANNAREAFTMLLTGQADYMLSSPYAAEAEARRFKIEKDIETTQSLFGPELFVAFSTNSPCRSLKSVFADILSQTKDSSREERMRLLIYYINEWGKRFKDAPGLKEQIASSRAPSIEAEANGTEE